MTTEKGFRASARPPSALRTPSFARHSRQIATQKSVFSDSGDRSHRRWRVSDIAEYRVEQGKNCPRRGSAAARSESPARGTGTVCGVSTGSCESVGGAGCGAFVAAAPLCANSREFVLYRALR